jgi:hypothetical protein
MLCKWQAFSPIAPPPCTTTTTNQQNKFALAINAHVTTSHTVSSTHPHANLSLSLSLSLHTTHTHTPPPPPQSCCCVNKVVPTEMFLSDIYSNCVHFLTIMCIACFTFSSTVFDPSQEFARNYRVNAFLHFFREFGRNYGHLGVIAMIRPLPAYGRNLNKWP